MNELSWMVLQLPLPPSVNQFMRKLGNQSPKVKQWIKEADAHYYRNQAWWSTKIFGRFECEIEFQRGRYDLDNRIKPLWDWLQRVEIVQNDRLCERLEVTWGPKNSGCLVRLRPWMEKS
jgi:Holliday junction resolvase RusA-like endonuclease